jgi:hypothetical protein
VTSTLLLLLTYVVVSFAAQAHGGEWFLAANQDDVLSALGAGVHQADAVLRRGA